MTDAADPRSAPWRRILCFPPLRLLLLGGALFLILAINGGTMERLAGAPWTAIAVVAAMAALALAVYAGFVRIVEARPVAELSPAGMGRDLGLGLLVGAGLYTACVAVLMALGFYRVEGLNPLAFLLPAVAMALGSGILEELLFRGALFRILEEWLGSWIALAVSSLVFGFMHLINPEATVLGALFISIEAGVLLGAAYMLTRRLWLGIGFHIAWNYTQSGIFSGVVSGSDSAPGLIQSRIAGPAALTGGSFGVEASLVAFLFCTATGVLLLVLAVRRGHVVRPAWRRPDQGVNRATRH